MKTYLCLGSNLGDSQALVAEAIRKIELLPQTWLVKASSCKLTKPYGYTEQPDFVNQVIAVKTELGPRELLRSLQQIEQDLGRTRELRWGPRTIDIDILLMEDLVLSTDELTIPHEDFHNRAFALELLCEIDEGLMHPVMGRSVKSLWDELQRTDKGGR